MPIEGTFIDKLQQQRDMQNGITDLEKTELTALFEKESAPDWKAFCAGVNKGFIDYHNINKNDDSMKTQVLDTLKLFVRLSGAKRNKGMGGPSASESINPEKLCEQLTSTMQDLHPGQDSYEEIFLMELFMMTDPEFSPTQQKHEEWKLDGKIDNVFKTKLTAYMDYLSTSKRLDPSKFSSSLGGGDKKRGNAVTLGIKSTDQEDETAKLKIGYETSVKLGKKTQITAQSNVQSPLGNTIQQTEQYGGQELSQNTPKQEIMGGVGVQVTHQQIGSYGIDYAKGEEGSSTIVRGSKTFNTGDNGSVTLGVANTYTKKDDATSGNVFNSTITVQQSIGKGNLSVQGNYTQGEQTNPYKNRKNELYGGNIAYRNSKTGTAINVGVTQSTEGITNKENTSSMIKEATTTGIFSAQQTVTKWEGGNITIGGNLKVKKGGSDTNNTPPISGDATIRVEF